MTPALVQIAAVLAASPGPRNDNPSTTGGVLIIVGVIVAVVLIAAIAAVVVLRVRGRGATSD